MLNYIPETWRGVIVGLKWFCNTLPTGFGTGLQTSAMVPILIILAEVIGQILKQFANLILNSMIWYYSYDDNTFQFTFMMKLHLVNII